MIMDDYYFWIPQFVHVHMWKEMPIEDRIEDNETVVAFRDNQKEQGAVHAFSLCTIRRSFSWVLVLHKFEYDRIIVNEIYIRLWWPAPSW